MLFISYILTFTHRETPQDGEYFGTVYCSDLLIAILVTLRSWQNCFYDTDDELASQFLLLHFGGDQ